MNYHFEKVRIWRVDYYTIAQKPENPRIRVQTRIVVNGKDMKTREFTIRRSKSDDFVNGGRF